MYRHPSPNRRGLQNGRTYRRIHEEPQWRIHLRGQKDTIHPGLDPSAIPSAARHQCFPCLYLQHNKSSAARPS